MARINSYEVVGFKRVDYPKKSGGEVHGCEVYLQPTTFDDGVTGTQCEAQWLSDKYAKYKPALGDVVRKSFNQFGGVEDLIPIPM